MNETGDTVTQPRWPWLSPDALSVVIAIITVGAALAALISNATANTHADMGALRTEVRTEAQADREAAQAARDADREAFQREILRLTAEQAEIAAIVKRNPS